MSGLGPSRHALDVRPLRRGFRGTLEHDPEYLVRQAKQDGRTVDQNLGLGRVETRSTKANTTRAISTAGMSSTQPASRSRPGVTATPVCSTVNSLWEVGPEDDTPPIMAPCAFIFVEYSEQNTMCASLLVVSRSRPSMSRAIQAVSAGPARS